MKVYQDFWILFTTLLFAAHAGAATSSCGQQSATITTTISNAADATSLAQACPTVWGNVELATGSTGDINLDGIQNITGSLSPDAGSADFSGMAITSLSSSTLLEIGGGLSAYTAPNLETISFPLLREAVVGFSLHDVDSLETLDLSSMQNVGSGFSFYNIPKLSQLNIPANVSTEQATVGIGIRYSSLVQISAFESIPTAIYITNNSLLTNFGTNIKGTTYGSSAKGAVVIAWNGPEVEVNFPELATTAGDLTLGNCSSISMPVLNSVNGSLSLLDASFNSLELPNLESINGSLTITGSFTGLSSFPSLSHVGGNLYVETSDYVDCAPFRNLSANSKIDGTFFCRSSLASPAASASPQAPESTSSSSSLSTGAKAGIAVGVVVGVLALVAIALLFVKRRRRAARPADATPYEFAPIEKPADSLEPSELPNESSAVHEIDGDGRRAHKLGPVHGHQIHELSS